MKQVLLTGFPGFLAAHLVEQSETNGDAVYWHLLVFPAEIAAAHTILRRLKIPATRFRLYPADLRDPQLDLSHEERTTLQSTVEWCFHFAALYDLTAPEAASYTVNVLGTRHLLDFLSDTPQLQKLNYISTCYVSGTMSGDILEDVLPEPPDFRNAYERTKHAAEAVVREYLDQIAITIYRPAVVVGHSATGATNKFDGPYNVILFFRWGHRLYFLMPNLGFDDSWFNSVPVDFVAQVIHRVGFDPEAMRSKTLHVADPEAPTTAQIFDELYHRITGRHTFGIPRWGKRLILRLLQYFPFNLITGITRQAIDYFSHHGRYATDNLRAACTQFNIPLPDWRTVYGAVVHYALGHDRPCPNAALVKDFGRWCFTFRMIYAALGLAILFAPWLVTHALSLWDEPLAREALHGDHLLWRGLSVSFLATLFIATLSLERKPFQKPLHIMFITAKTLSALFFLTAASSIGSLALLMSGVVDGLIGVFHALFYIRLGRVQSMGGDDTHWSFYNIMFPTRFIRNFCQTMSPDVTYPLDAEVAELGVRWHVRHMPWHMRYLFVGCAYYCFLLLPLCYGRPPYLLMPESWRLRFLARVQHARFPLVRIPLLFLKMVATAYIYKQPAYLRSIGAI